MQRDISIGTDIAKAIGIFLVVTGHVIRGLINANIINANTEIWLMIDRSIYLFHMPLFFFLSGLFFKSSFLKKGFMNLTKRNCLVLLIPMIVWSYLQFGLQYAASGSTNSNITIHDLIYAPFPPKQQFWFLWALFKITIITGLILKLNKSSIALAVASATCIALSDFNSNPVSGFIGLDVLRNLPYFALGIFVIEKNINDFKIKTFFLLLLISLAISINLWIVDLTEAVRFLLATICLLSVFKISINLSLDYPTKFKSHIQRCVVFIGMNSMIIYLAHVIFEASYRALLIKLGVYSIPIHFLGGVLVGLFLPLFLINLSLLLSKHFPNSAPFILPAKTYRQL